MARTSRVVIASALAASSANSALPADNVSTSYGASAELGSWKNDIIFNFGSSGILVGIVAVYPKSVIDMEDDFRKTCLILNGAHTERYDHSFVVRQTATLGGSTNSLAVAWEKIALLIDYLEQDYRYVLTIDVDAAIARHDLDVVSGMARELEASSRDLLFTDCQGISVAGWECLSHGCINTGVMMARNTPWTRAFLRELLADTAPGAICEEFAQRWGWENTCLAKRCQLNPALFDAHVLIVSGDQYNRASGSIASYLYNCSLVPFTIADGFTLFKCKDLHDRYLQDSRMHILHLIPGRLGSYTMLFDLYNLLLNEYGTIGHKWFRSSNTRVARDVRRERSQQHMVAIQSWDENPFAGEESAFIVS